MNGRSYVSRMFLFYAFPTHLFRRLQTDIFETFPHDVALLEKEALLCCFPKVPRNKNEGRKKHQILPNLASNRNILCAITRNVEGKWKIENNSVSSVIISLYVHQIW